MSTTEGTTMNACDGHPAGAGDPMGVTVYCDGTCRPKRRSVSTTKAKAARKQVAAYFLSCPTCDGEMESPCGSLMFTIEECDGKTVTCSACGAAVKLPKMV